MRKFFSKSVIRGFVLLPALLLGTHATPVEAEQKDAIKSVCKPCVKYYGWRGVVGFGPGNASDDSLRFGDIRGLEKDSLYFTIDGELHFRNTQGQYFDLYARDLGLDSRQLEARGGQQGRYQLRFAWNELPKYRGFGTQTPFLGVGSDNLTLPADFVRSFNTAGLSKLADSLTSTRLKTSRKTLDLGLSLNLGSKWRYDVDFQHQEKNGTRAFGAGVFFSNTTVFPVPVDFTTDQFDMGLSFEGEHGHLRFGFIGSDFDNGKPSLSWQNPFSSGPGQDTLRVALEPGNQYFQFNLTGTFVLSPSMSVSGQVATGRLKQNEPFIPFTTNPAFSNLPLPRESLNAKLDTNTLNVSGKLSARLSRRLRFSARVKLDERDNRTPVDTYTPVTTDFFPGEQRINRPYSYDRTQISANLRYRAHRNIRLSGGVKREDLDRTLQAIEGSKDVTWWGEARLSPMAIAQLRLKFETSQRDVSDYLQPADGGPVDHPLLRKFNQADRDRDLARVEFDLSPTPAMGINLSIFNAEAKYKNSALGLQRSKEQNYSINLDYAVAKILHVYAFVSRDDIDAEIISASSVTATPWQAITQDKITTAGLGLSASLGEKLDVRVDFISSTSKGDIAVKTQLDEDPFKPLRTDLRDVTFHFDYKLSEHWGYKLLIEHENYEARNWAIDGLGVDGISSVLTLGEQSPDYKAWYFRAQANYRF